MRSPGNVGLSIVGMKRGSYVPNTEIFIFPINIPGAGQQPAWHMKSATVMGDGTPILAMWIQPNSGSEILTNSGVNFLNPAGTTHHEHGPIESKWPIWASELVSQRAFITHRVSDTPGGALWNSGHLGLGLAGWGYSSKPLWAFSVTPDQPVGMADGSVVIHPKVCLKKRALFANTTFYY